MAFDLRVLRSALVPLALLVCVTVALWDLRARHVAPTGRNVPTLQHDQPVSQPPPPRPSTGSS